jgi:hypothetical protein
MQIVRAEEKDPQSLDAEPTKFKSIGGISAMTQ